MLFEHGRRVDGDEDTVALGEDFSGFVADLGGVDVNASVDFLFPSDDGQVGVQGDRAHVVDLHGFGEGDDFAEFVHFAHGFIEDGGDDAAVAVSGRALVALRKLEAADGFVVFEDELEVHAVGIVGAAAEAFVFGEDGGGIYVAISARGGAHCRRIAGRVSGDGERRWCWRQRALPPVGANDLWLAELRWTWDSGR